jgi:insulysin
VCTSVHFVPLSCAFSWAIICVMGRVVYLQAAASLEVAVGQFQDPVQVPGLAHFCEHMLFMGTKMFPDENYYSVLVSKNGGSSNAYTASEQTNYQFDVQHQHLRDTLECFSRFFIDPLFAEGATGREMQAVHSEHSKNLQNDMWRFYQLWKSTANPAHPLSRFGTGSEETLKIVPERDGIDVRQELLKFHKTYYSANLMTLAVLGRESLDELQDMVTRLFTEVPNFHVQLPVETIPPLYSNFFFFFFIF